MITDIYSSGVIPSEHSLRFLHIKTYNVVGILNRIASLLRRRRYNMEEVSVSFDNAGHAHIVIAIDGIRFDIDQVIHQVEKLHDVISVIDISSRRNELMYGVYVRASDETLFQDFPLDPVRVIHHKKGGVTGIFAVPLDDSRSFFAYIQNNEYYFTRRLLSIV